MKKEQMKGDERTEDRADAFIVFVPTTGKLIRIESLKERPRLPNHYVTLKEDFRPLPISQDYHHLVTGPLKSYLDYKSVFELALSDAIESGRSWELPVCIAHLLHDVGDLASLEKPSKHDDVCTIIWSTGMMSPDLDIVESDYHAGQKLKESIPALLNWLEQQVKIIFFLPGSLKVQERQQFEEFAVSYPCEIHFVNSLVEVKNILDLKADTRLPLTQERQDGVGKGRHIWGKIKLNQWNIYLFGLLLMAGLGIFLVTNSKFFSTSSIIQSDNEIHTLTGQKYEVLSLHVPNGEACAEYMMRGKRLTERFLVGAKSGRFQYQVTNICGLRLKNKNRKPIQIQLGPKFLYVVIAGNPFFEEIELLPENYADILFSNRFQADFFEIRIKSEKSLEIIYLSPDQKTR